MIALIFTTSLPWHEQKEMSYVRILLKNRIDPPYKTNEKQHTMYHKCP